MMCDKSLTVEEVSKILKMDSRLLKKGIKQGRLWFGEYIENNGRGCYHISSSRLQAYLTAQDMRPMLNWE